LGRSNVIHAALLAGPESETFLARIARLDCFRTGPVPGSPGMRKHGSRKSAGAGVRRDGYPNTAKARELGLEWLKRRKRLAKRS
jgi:hypothetical protein